MESSLHRLQALTSKNWLPDHSCVCCADCCLQQQQYYAVMDTLLQASHMRCVPDPSEVTSLLLERYCTADAHHAPTVCTLYVFMHFTIVRSGLCLYIAVAHWYLEARWYLANFLCWTRFVGWGGMLRFLELANMVHGTGLGGFGGAMFKFLELENMVHAMEKHGCGATICSPIEASKWSLPRFDEPKFVVNALQEKALSWPYPEVPGRCNSKGDIPATSEKVLWRAPPPALCIWLPVPYSASTFLTPTPPVCRKRSVVSSILGYSLTWLRIQSWNEKNAQQWVSAKLFLDFVGLSNFFSCASCASRIGAAPMKSRFILQV